MTTPGRDRELDAETLCEALDIAFVTGDFREALDELDADDVSVDHLMRQVASSDRAREHFNQLACAERALGAATDSDVASNHPGSSQFERALEAAALDSALDAQFDEPDAETDRDSEPGSNESDGGLAEVVPLFGETARWGAVAAMALATLGALYLLVPTSSNPGDESFQPRSAATPETRDETPTPRVRMFCLRRNDGNVAFSGPSDSPGDALECPIDGELKFAYRNPSSTHRYAAFFGVSDGGDVFWYGPSPAAPSPVEIELETDKPKPIGETIRLEVNHDPGKVHVYGVFSERPIGFDRLSKLVESHRSRFVDGDTDVDLSSFQIDHSKLELEEVAQ